MEDKMENLKKLAEKFKQNEVEWRAAQVGFTKAGKPWAKVLCYVDARAIMQRLDDVVGPENWRDEFEKDAGGVMCGLSIWCERKQEWITKWDGSPETAVEAYKGGISKSSVRCAVKWGIGRYLYDLGETFAEQTTTDMSFRFKDGWTPAKCKKTNNEFCWFTPSLSKEFLPDPKPTPKQHAEKFDPPEKQNNVKPVASDPLYVEIFNQISRMTNNSRHVEKLQVILDRAEVRAINDLQGLTDDEKNEFLIYLNDQEYEWLDFYVLQFGRQKNETLSKVDPVLLRDHYQWMNNQPILKGDTIKREFENVGLYLSYSDQNKKIQDIRKNLEQS